MRFRLAGRNDRRLKDEGTDLTPDQVEGDIKDTVYQLRESPTPSFPTPDQVGGDVKDKVYQLRESFTPSFLSYTPLLIVPYQFAYFIFETELVYN